MTLQTRVQLGARNFKLFALPASNGLPTRIVADISKPRIPSVLVEMGFATHRVEGVKLGTPAYRQRIAAGIARGTVAFLGL